MAAKFDHTQMSKNMLKIEVEGPPIAPGLPGRKERLAVCHVDNLILVNLSPCMSRGDTTSVYDFVRGSKDPQDTL